MHSPRGVLGFGQTKGRLTSRLGMANKSFGGLTLFCGKSWREMKVFLASDHAGWALKEEVKKMLLRKDFEARDFGAFSLEPSDDYPDYIIPCCEAVAKENAGNQNAGGKKGGENVFGIVFGGSGIGESIAANKVNGIRAAIAYSEETAKLCREHNNSNVLCLGGRTMKPKDAKKFVEIFLRTKFSGKERHARRLKKISWYENKTRH